MAPSRAGLRVAIQGLQADAPGVRSLVSFFSTQAAPSTAKQNPDDLRARARAQRDFKLAMTELRREWQAEQAAKRAQREARLAAEHEKQRAAQAVAQERRARRKGANLARQAQLEAAQQAARAEKRNAARQWRGAQGTVYAYLQDRREQALLEQSRHWIRPGELDARIEHALSHPQPLYPDASPLPSHSRDALGGLGYAEDQAPEDAAASGPLEARGRKWGPYRLREGDFAGLRQQLRRREGL